MSEMPELTRRELKIPWYVEKWYDGDLEVALIEAGIPVSDERIAKLRGACTGIFDDLSDRTELLKQKAEELFEDETDVKDKSNIEFNYRTENLMENGDWIRSMNDEELAVWLHNLAQFESEKDEEWWVSMINKQNRLVEIHDSYGDWKSWLSKKAR